MKKYSFLLAVLLLSVFVFFGQSSPETAETILKDACVQATKEQKKVFIIFHASWCVWCHRMDSSMNDPSCKKFFDDNFVVRHMVVDESKNKKNLENPGADELKNKYGGNNQGIPYWLVFDADGKFILNSKEHSEKPGSSSEGDNMGCPATEKEVNYFVEVLKKISRLSAEQELAIRKRFRQNEH